MKVNGAIFNYNQYLEWMSSLVAQGKTSGSNQSEALIQFTALNLKRMERLNKTVEIENRILDALVSLEGKQIWYVIAEVWCGDCAQNLPVIGKIAELSNSFIDLRIIQRDENPEWMEKYHTNGARAVPKLISFNAFGQELFTWGARPKPAQKLLNDWKQNPESKSWDEFETQLHTWYAKDKTKTQQAEFFEILLSINQLNKVGNANFICNN